MDRKLSALYTGASQCSLEGSDLNSMHTPVASELTAISVLKVEKEVNKKERKEKKKKEIYSQCHYEQFNEDICSMPSGGQSLDKTQDCVKGMGMRCGNIMPFYKSALHPHSEYGSQGQLSHLNKNINERVKGQRS